jgi:hypothetical protein
MNTYSNVTATAIAPQHTGQYGDASIISGQFSTASAIGVTGDTVVIDLAKIPAGTEVHDWHLRYSAIGTAASGKLGFRYVDPARAAKEPNYGTASAGFPTPAADYFMSAASIAAAGATGLVLFTPVKFELPVILQLTVDSTTAATLIPAAATIVSKLNVKAKGSK